MDTKKVLLGSTAIVGAGILLANPAHAQIEVTLAGYTEFGVVAAENDAINPGLGDRGYDFFMDNEVFVRAQGVDDATGITYGTRLEIEVGTDVGGAGTGEVSADEVMLFFSSGFGRVELGREDGAADVMMLDAASVAAGTGGIDGDLPINLTGENIFDSGDAEKITYFTPRVAGFQVGASYNPDSGEDAEDDAVDDIDAEDVIEAGVNFVGEFAGLDVGVAGVGTFAEFEDEDLDEITSFAFGGTVGFAGLNFGAAFGHDEIGEVEREFATAGVAFGLGPANASFNYEYNDPDILFGDEDSPLEDAHLFVLSADVGLMPGVVLKGDLGYTTEDVDIGDVFTEDDDEEGGDIIAGVITVQLNY